MRRLHPITLLIACGCVLIAAIAIGTAMMILHFRDKALSDSERELSNTALVLAEHSDRAFQSLELVQKNLIERMQALGIASSEDYERRMSGLDVHLMLKDKISGLPHVEAITLFDSEGNLVNFSRSWPLPSLSVADRDHFKALKSNPQLTSVVSAPVLNRVNDSWTVYLARKFSGPNGEFLGSVNAGLELNHFERLFGTIALGDESEILLFRRDGVLLARHPQRDALGSSYAQSPLFKNVLSQTDHAAVRPTSVVDGKERLIAGHSLAHYPVVVAVSTTVSAALAKWREETKFVVIVAGLAALVIGIIFFLIVRQLSLGHRRSQQMLSEQKLQLDTALNNISQGLCMFDAEQRLVVCNDRYLEMYGLSRETAKPGCTIRDLIAQYVATELFVGDREQYVAGIMREMAENQTLNKIVNMADGRTVAIVNRSLPGGGRVATHEDITERQRAERQARQAHARLREVVDVMPAGLVFYDERDRLVLWNRCYDDLYPETADLRVVGVRFEDMLRAGLARGIYAEAEGRENEWLAERLGLHAYPRKVHEQSLSNGRWLRVEDCRTADGGFIGIRVDITELKRREDELKLQNMRFNAALQTMSPGLAMFDSHRDLIVCNDQYARLYGLPSELTQPGTTQAQILEHRCSSGVHTGPIAEQYMKVRIAEPTHGKPTDAILELDDGRVIAVANRPTGDGGWVSTHEDITERRRSEQHIAHMAHHDALTDLPNRVSLRTRLENALSHVRRGERLAVHYLDLDQFKNVNDTLGHLIGDELLKAVADRLRASLRDTDIIARLGGDEFAIVQTALEQPTDAAIFAQRIREVFQAPYELKGHQIVVDASIGIAVAPSDGVDSDQLLKNADLALYRAKGDGRGTYRFFEPEMDARVKVRRALELDLRKALRNGEFELHYQPIVNLAHNEISGCEALLRWHHPERGMILPAEFIPVAEETGLIMPLGEWVLRTACTEAANWPDEIKVAVNVSPVQFKSQALGLTIASALAVSNLPARRLEVEITEAVLMQHNEATLATLHQLRSLGVLIALDDFGTGYSSLSYLRGFPFDKIKIDRSFVENLTDRDASISIVRAVISLANSLNMTITAEGVETEQQRDTLRAAGCTEIQGYLISRPRPATDIVRLFPSRVGKMAGAA